MTIRLAESAPSRPIWAASVHAAGGVHTVTGSPRVNVVSAGTLTVRAIPSLLRSISAVVGTARSTERLTFVNRKLPGQDVSVRTRSSSRPPDVRTTRPARRSVNVCPGLGRDGERALRRHDVVALVGAL